MRIVRLGHYPFCANERFCGKEIEVNEWVYPVETTSRVKKSTKYYCSGCAYELFGVEASESQQTIRAA